MKPDDSELDPFVHEEKIDRGSLVSLPHVALSGCGWNTSIPANDYFAKVSTEYTINLEVTAEKSIIGWRVLLLSRHQS